MLKNRKMKRINLFIVLLVVGAMSFTSCKKYFGDINVDPDNPTKVTVNVLLPQIEMRLAYTLWGDYSRFVGIYTAHLDGVGRQFAVIDNYGIIPSDVDAPWDNLYSGVLMDSKQMMDIAAEGGYNHYIGVGQAITAYTLMLLTDMYDDIPYSTALDGTNTINPTFDTQEDVYNTIFGLLADAVNNLDKDDGGNPVGGDDFIYGGDVDAWKGFASVLEARGWLHLGKVDANNYNKALTAINNGSTFTEARVGFGTGATEQAPWFQYLDQRTDIEVGSQYVAKFDTNDARLAVYGNTLQDEPPSSPYFVKDRMVPLLSMTEKHFIEAEAYMKTSDQTSAHTHWLLGIESSFLNDAGLTQADADAYKTLVDPGAGNLTMDLIMTEKYIALFADPEVFNDWRRTGMPTIDPKVGNEVPRRLPYSQNEILSNPNTPSQADWTIYSRVWWDK
jgi:Starch-binding associating with outer membrane